MHKHIFRPGDNLQIGGFELRYVMEADTAEPVNEKHAIVRPITPGRRPGLPKGRLSFLQGPEAGKTQLLKDPLFTIGCPGEDVAVISRRIHGIYLLHIGGEMPKVNGVEMTKNTAPLKQGDVIDVGEHRVRITLEKLL